MKSYRWFETIIKRLQITCFIMSAFLLSSCFGQAKQVSLPDDLPVEWSFSPEVSMLPVTRTLLELFDNPELENLVVLALQNNYDLKATALRLEASDILLSTSRYNYLPRANVSVRKSRDNQGLNPLTGDREKQNHHRATLNINWELDIWGKLADQRNIKALQSEMNQIEYEGAYDSLAARVIQTCLSIMGTQKLLDVQKAHVTNLEMIEHSISRRYVQGIGSIKDLSTAKTRTWTGKAQISELEENLNESKRMLTVYMGQYPDTLEGISVADSDIDLPAFSVPIQVLKNRPDIQKAMLHIRAEQFTALVSKKEMLPGFNITADWGKKGSTISKLINGNGLWSLVGSIVQPVFQGRQLFNQAKSDELLADASVHDLKQTVLSALKEVEDKAGLELDLGRQTSFLKTALSEATISREDYSRRYRLGLVSLIDLLVIVEQETQIKTRLIQTQTRRLANRVDLALAAGAGA